MTAASVVAPYRVLVAIDLSDTSRLALDEALGLASRRTRSELHLVSVVDDAHGGLLDRHVPYEELVDEARRRLTTFASEHGPKPATEPSGSAPIPTILHVRVGRVADQIVSLAAEIRVDLVVTGTHGRRGLHRFLIGSVAERVTRLAPVPVLVVRPRDFSVMAGLPAIEPPCPACVARREATAGEHWWCERHEARRPEPHVYSYSGLTDPATPRHHLL